MSDSTGKLKAQRSKIRVDFRYDASHDLIIATPRCVIETAQDVAEWYNEYASYMQNFDRKMDMVIVLDSFEIKPGIGVIWGEARGRTHQNFIRFSYRVHATNRVQLFVNTSGVRYNVATQEAETVEDAIQGILAARRAAKVA